LIQPFLMALLAFVALLPILVPLLRGSRPTATRASFDQAVYRDQLQELDRDIARGLITPTEANAARLEIQRRLLAADQRPVAPPRLARSPVLAAIVFVVIAGGSVGGYLWLGAPGLPDQPFAARKGDLARENGPSSLQQATDALAARLKQNPSDASGWLLYGRSLAMLSQWDRAEDAYRHAMDLGQNGPDVAGDHAEIMVMQAGGTVTPAAEAAFQQVLRADPGSAIARYYLAVAAMQAGQPAQAIDGFQSLLAGLPEGSPLRAPLGQKVAEAARAAGSPVPELAKGTPAAPLPPSGPIPGASAPDASAPEASTPGAQAPGTQAPGTQAPGAQAPAPQPSGPDAKAIADAAAMTEEQRQAMIRGMVANLAAKQQADPGNVDGWLRLGRAYAVLHQADQAAEAYDKAAKLRPDDVSIPLQEVRALLIDRAPTDKLPPRAIGLLKQVEATDPEQPLVLWYLGMAAVQDARRDDARRYWSKLLTKVPAGSDDARMIQTAVDALAKK
jgi:cytochrome c-type biogenesis protein CcmH